MCWNCQVPGTRLRLADKRETMFPGSLPLFLTRGYTAFHQQDAACRQMFAGRRRLKQLDTGNAAMAEGTIKKLTDRGFGFIKTNGEKDLFFHSSSVQAVSFA